MMLSEKKRCQLWRVFTHTLSLSSTHAPSLFLAAFHSGAGPTPPPRPHLELAHLGLAISYSGAPRRAGGGTTCVSFCPAQISPEWRSRPQEVRA